MPRNRVGKTAFLNFDSDLLTFGFVRFPEKIAKIEQKVIVFFLGRQEEIGPWFCDIRIALWLTFCVKAIFFFFISAIFRGNGKSKLNQKCEFWLSTVSVKIWIFQRFLKYSFFFLNNTPGENFIKIGQHLKKLGPKKPPKRAISWMLNQHEKLWKFITWQPQMLYSWNLPRLCIFLTPSIWRKIEVWLLGVRGRKRKISGNEPENFLASFWWVFRLHQKSWHYW